MFPAASKVMLSGPYKHSLQGAAADPAAKQTWQQNNMVAIKMVRMDCSSIPLISANTHLQTGTIPGSISSPIHDRHGRRNRVDTFDAGEIPQVGMERYDPLDQDLIAEHDPGPD